MTMGDLRVKGDFVGPGEEKTANFLRDHLPSGWVIFASRSLPGEARDDVDLIVVGMSSIFVVEEKAWGPRIVVGDRVWYVEADPRTNPLGRCNQLARKLAGLLRSRAQGYRNLYGKRVKALVILSHDDVRIHRSPNHDDSEVIVPLSEAAALLTAMDAEASGLGAVRPAVLKFLDDTPRAHRDTRMGVYLITATLEGPGIETRYEARAPDGTRVILKCYPVQRLSEYGDPMLFLRRESDAINRLAEHGRTWRAFPFFKSEAHEMFVVPVVPPLVGRSLLDSRLKNDPQRAQGRLDEEVARRVVRDAFSALSDLHNQGLVHRALHPSRVWLGRGLRVMFSDLQLARIEGAQSIALWAPDHDVSESYRAPECHASIGLATSASDVFSLSLCLLEWVLGQKITVDNQLELEERFRKDWPWAIPLLSGLSHTPEDRPTASTLISELAEPVPRPSLEPDVFAVGAKVAGRYEIKAELGSGGFATTWLCYDTQVQQRRVIKEFRRDLPEEALAEFKAADRLAHERCGRVYDVQVDSHPRYLVSEYVEGSSLADIAPPLEVDSLRDVALAVCDGLAYVHARDMVHGDVAPGNVIVPETDPSASKLIDFGLAISIGDLPHGHNPAFAAPEVVAGLPASSASDLYGLAASILHAMLGRAVSPAVTGVSSNGPTEAEMNQWGSEGQGLMRILLRAMNVEVEGRPESAEELASEIRTVRESPTDRGASAAPSHPAAPGAESALVRKINPVVDDLRRLYRASSLGNGGNRGLDDDFAQRTYVSTMLDSELTPKVLNGDLTLVLLSGNPGDGKTSVLVKIGEELRRRGAHEESADDAGWVLRLGEHRFIAVFDASESHGELSSDELVEQALRPVLDDPEHATALIAVNDGRLIQFFTDHEHEFEDWKLDIDAQLDGEAGDDPRVVVVDLKRRSLAALDAVDGLAVRALAALNRQDLWDACLECTARNECPILANHVLMGSSGQAAFAELVLTSHLRRRRRATFRDVRSAAAWVLTGDRGCEDVHQLIEEQRVPSRLPDARSFDLAFSSRSGDYLIDEWSELDPAMVAAPAVDELRRGIGRTGVRDLAVYPTATNVMRALYFGDWTSPAVDGTDVRAYRYLTEFKNLLSGYDLEVGRDRVLLGISRLAGVFGFDESGLAIRGGGDDTDWAVLHVVDAEQFELVMPAPNAVFVEVVPDRLVLRHRGGAELSLTLDSAELLLRASDGEVVNDAGADSVRQEVDGFVGQLARQPSDRALIVDSSGSATQVWRDGGQIRLMSS